MTMRDYEVLTKMKDSTDMDLEINKMPVVQCPINGWQLQSRCECGIWRYMGYEDPCHFYKGKKELVDLSGEKFTVIHCEAERLRKRSGWNNELKSLQSEVTNIDKLIEGHPESSAIETVSLKSRKESLLTKIKEIKEALGANNNVNK